MNRSTASMLRTPTRYARTAFAVAALAFAGVFASACDEKQEITGEPQAISISVAPNPQSLVAGATQQFVATGKNASGGNVAIVPTWSIVSGGGTINATTGMFTAGSVPGTYANTVRATANGLSATATVTVTVGAIATIVVTPNPMTLAAGAAQQYTAVARDAAGNVVAFTPAWSVVAGGGTIGAATGIFTAGSTPGTFANTVRATDGTIAGTATVTVTVGPVATIVVTPNPVTLATGATQQYTAVARDAAGNIVTITPTWSVVAGGGTISATGLFTAGNATGSFVNTVQATSGTISGNATVTVTAGALATITVTPNPATLGLGAAQQFTAVGRDAAGNTVTITPTWSVAAGGGTIGTSGLFTAGTVSGTFTNTVVATSGTISGSATVIVVPGALTTITVTPNPASLATGASQQFTAVGKDASGNVVAFIPTWTVTAGGGTIASLGLFTAGNTTGTFPNTVQATSGTISGNATVTVTAGALASITVSPNPATLAPGGAQTFTAVGKDANGNVVAITPVWSASALAGTINAGTGAFTAGATPGTFNNAVTATSGTIAGSATVTVTAPPPVIATITVTPDPAVMQTGGTQQFTAVARDAAGVVVAFTPVWSIANGGGTISSTGLFTGGATPGTFTNTVRATSGTVSGSASVTLLGTAITVIVTPNPGTVQTGGTLQFTAVGRDAANNTVQVSPVWTVVNGGGTISSSGLFTAGITAGTFNSTIRATVGTAFGIATVIVTTPTAPDAINLGSAAVNGIMAGTAVTCVSGGIVNAGVAISPGNTLTGFGPCVINGVTHLGDAIAAQAQIDLTTAYNTLAGLPCPPANAIVADLGGTTKAAGVYCTASGIGVTGILTLDGGGNPNARFVFQAGTTLTTAGSIVLINGAQAKNVYWQVGSSATLGTGTAMQGNILALASITFVTNATLTGRALARTGAVTLGTGNIIILP